VEDEVLKFWVFVEAVALTREKGLVTRDPALTKKGARRPPKKERQEIPD
jgi:hypothetical protein